MDDLSGLDWSSKPTGSQAKPPPMNMNPSYPSLRPSPSPFDSGRNTPLQPQSSAASAGLQRQASSSSSTTTKPTAAAGATGTDSFSNLMKFGPAKTNANLSLAERQAQLEAERKRKEEEKRRQTEAAFGNGAFWDNLGTRGASTASPASVMSGIAAPPSNGAKNDDDDLFAAFNKDTQVDNASHYPPPPESRKSTPANALDLSDPNAWGSKPTSGGFAAEDDDDPFGLNDMKRSANAGSAPAPAPQPADDDDFLGDLGRPVEDIRREQEAARPKPQPKTQPGKPIEGDDSSSDDEPAPARRPAPRREASSGGDDFDRAVAKLVDYGFTPDDARRGITESGAGTNVQAVANWLLDDAHRRAKEKARGRNPDAAPGQSERRPNRSPANGGDDLAKTAAAVGNSLFKTANSLWKTGSKKMQQAYADFQQDGDPNQPKWMREAQLEQQQGRRARQQEVQSTDEALMLESEGPSRSNRSSQRQPQPPRTASQQSRGQPSSRQNSPAPRWQQQSAPPATFDSKARLNRLAADDDISSYSSPNRRRRQTPQAEPKKTEPEPDLLFGTTETQKPTQSLPQRPAQRSPAPQQPQPARRPQPKPSSPAPSRPARQIPSISPDALQASTKHRQAGTAHFKRGDYASAHASYSSSLNSVPPQHPLVIVLLTNRALTALKTGEPKQAVDDADKAIALIGPGNGQGETVAVRGENGQDENRDMKDLYGKALSRKAEALEQMEKWGDAGGVWQQCVEAGVGGPNAIKGRQRCQAALAPKPKPKPAAAKPRPRPSATASLAPAKSSEAVTRLREANEAAAKEDDEKFALSESVDARVSAWRDGKRDNLRALLGSMDNVLWANSGWKKVGLHELVAPNKVKINYMKAIAKTHPDKLPQDASTEVRLIAGLVFSTLNESWDKFKADNGL